MQMYISNSPRFSSNSSISACHIVVHKKCKKLMPENCGNQKKRSRRISSIFPTKHRQNIPKPPSPDSKQNEFEDVTSPSRPSLKSSLSAEDLSAFRIERRRSSTVGDEPVPPPSQAGSELSKMRRRSIGSGILPPLPKEKPPPPPAGEPPLPEIRAPTREAPPPPSQEKDELERRNKVVKEILETEKSYVKNLHTCVELFLNDLMELAVKKTRKVKEKVRGIFFDSLLIFSNKKGYGQDFLQPSADFEIKSRIVGRLNRMLINLE